MSRKDKLSSLIKNTAIFSIGLMGSRIINYILTPLYTTYMTSEQYGVADLIYTTLQLIIPLLTLRIAAAMFRFALGKENCCDNRTLLSNSVLICILSTVFLIPVCIIISRFIVFTDPLLFALLFLIVSTNEVLANFAKAENKNIIYVVNSLIQSILLLGSSYLFLAVLDCGINGYFYALVLSNLFSNVLLLVLCRTYKYIRISAINIRTLKEMIRYSLPLVPGAISFWVIQSSDRYMVMWFINASVAGLYAVAYKIPNICGVLVKVFSQAWEISAIENSSDVSFMESVFKRYSSIVFFSCGSLILAAKIIANIFFKNEFINAYNYVPPLIFAFLFSFFREFFESVLIAKKNTKMIMITNVLGALVNIALNFVLIVFFEVYGAIIATGISYIIVFIVRYKSISNNYGLKIDKIYFAINISVLLLQSIVAIMENNLCVVMNIACWILILIMFLKYNKELLIKLVRK